MIQGELLIEGGLWIEGRLLIEGSLLIEGGLFIFGELWILDPSYPLIFFGKIYKIGGMTLCKISQRFSILDLQTPRAKKLK